MSQSETIRRAAPQDFAVLDEVMFNSVRTGPSLYSEAQKIAWLPEARQGAVWNERLQKQKIVLAEKGATVLGFMSLAEEGYIDFAYICPAARGAGLFRRLFEEIEVFAIESNQRRL